MGTRFARAECWDKKTTRSSPATTLPSRAQALAALSPPSSPAAATISGDGVSPAAIAAARGLPPGKAAATCIAERGRDAGSFSRQRRITRSTAASISGVSLEGGVGCSRKCLARQSETLLASQGRLPVYSSNKTIPSEYKSLCTVAGLPSKDSGAM